MKGTVLLFCLFSFIPTLWAKDIATCDSGPDFAKHVCRRWHQIWHGTTEVYVSGYAWHNRYRYDADHIGRYNEQAWGGGLGKGFYDEDGDWHALSAIAFLDSHSNVEPAEGYTFLKIWRFNDNTRLGGGFSALVTSRPDILHGVPFPGVLPWVSLTYRRASLNLTYVPGSRNVGNVLFILTRWTLG